MLITVRLLLWATVLEPLTARASSRDVLLAGAGMEGRAQHTSATWCLCPLPPSGSFSEAQTPLPAELCGAAELCKVQPDTPAAKTSSHWIICARQTTQKCCDSNKLPQLPASPTHFFPYLLENSSYPSVPPIPFGQAGKRSFLGMSVSSQELHCSPRSTRQWQKVLGKGFAWGWQFCAEQPGERENLLDHSSLNSLHLICTEEVRNVHSVKIQRKLFLLYCLTGFHFINISRKQISDKVKFSTSLNICISKYKALIFFLHSKFTASIFN